VHCTTVYKLEKEVCLIDVAPPIEGSDGFLGSYIIRGQQTAVIDPGPASTVRNLLTGLNKLGVDPKQVKYILATHIHLDHTGGVGHLISTMPNAKVIVHEKGRPHLVNPTRLWQGSLQVLGQMARDYGEPAPVPEEKVITAVDGMKIDLGGLVLEVLTTPGHATHHLSFFDRLNRGLFAGESAGNIYPDLDVCLPSTPSPFDLKQALQSLDKMIALRPKTIFYAHFGRYPNAAERLKQCQQNLLLYNNILCYETKTEENVLTNLILDSLKSREQFYQCSPDRLKLKFNFMHANISGFLEYLEREKRKADLPG
jgi:glyoxylase-like metal-dependent hydrolase (beta-lactamase superfamily II)